MSDLLKRGFAQLLSLGGGGIRDVTIISDSPPPNPTFKAILQINPQVEIPSELVNDTRARALMQVDRASLPCPLKKSDSLKDSCGNFWDVWGEDNNPATFTVNFWLTQNVRGKDL